MFPIIKWEAFLSRKSVHPDRKPVILPVFFIISSDVIFLLTFDPALSGSVGGCSCRGFARGACNNLLYSDSKLSS